MSIWIPANKRLPEDDALKVVKYEPIDTKQHLGVDLSRYYIPANMTRKVWCFEFNNTQNTRITHWADLPKGIE
jgi:hypothetical protein